MKDLVSSVAVGCIDGNVVADLNYDEEAFDGVVADIPVAILPNSGEVSLLQMDGELSKENLVKGLELAKKVCKDIYEVQKKALKEKYTVTSGKAASTTQGDEK
jgi:exosome complex component RRP41